MQHAVWQFCAQQGYDICNGNNIDDFARCANFECQLYRRCDRRRLHPLNAQHIIEASAEAPTASANNVEHDMTAKKSAKTTKPAKAATPKKEATKPKATKKSKSLFDPDTPVIVLFGRDENGKPRAARLPGFNLDLVHRAARLMGYRAVETSVGEAEPILKRLPLGRLFADGKALAPPISEDTYDLISKAVGDLGKISTVLPRTWDGLMPGHLVIAQDSPTNGWFEAVVIERNGDALKIMWRDFGQEPVVRHMDYVALITQAPPPE